MSTIAQYTLHKKIKKPTIVCGYNSAGFVGSLIVNQFIEKMDFTEVGSSQLREIPPTVALKEEKILKPISLFYNEEHNILLIFILAPIQGIEWEVSDLIEQIYTETEAKEIVIPDGFIGPEGQDVYYFVHKKDDIKLSNAEKMTDAVLSGILPALLLKDISLVGIMGNLGASDQTKAKAATGIPSNRIAIEVLNSLNEYLGVSIPTDELEEMGEEIEQQFGEYMKQIQEQQQDNQNQPPAQGMNKPTQYIR